MIKAGRFHRKECENNQPVGTVKRVWETPVISRICRLLAKYQPRIQELLKEFRKAGMKFMIFINPLG